MRSMDMELLAHSYEAVRARWPAARPRAGVILGSGWSAGGEDFESLGEIAYSDIPALGAPGVTGHAGLLTWARIERGEFLLFHGRRHFYEGAGWTPVAAPPYLLKRLGCRLLVLTNAAGGIGRDLQVGDLMIIKDHIHAMGANPLQGRHDPFWGPRFPDQSEVYSRHLREAWRRAAQRTGLACREGVYLAVRGPAFETPAEIRAYRMLGADAVGMSTAPEAMLAHAAGLAVAGLSCITNLAAGLAPAPLSHEEVSVAGAAAAPRMRRLLRAFLEDVLAQDTR